MAKPGQSDSQNRSLYSRVTGPRLPFEGGGWGVSKLGWGKIFFLYRHCTSDFALVQPSA